MKTISTFAIAGLVAGCSAGTSAPTSPDTGNPAASPSRAPTAVERVPPEDVATNLARLSALQIFEVYGVVEHIPESANCYSVPCPGHEAEFQAAKTAAAARLAAFTSTAVAAAAHPMSDCYIDVQGQAQDNLAALRALEVVNIGALIVEQPKNNPNCYNLPCPEDQQAAGEINRGRARALASIAAAVKNGL